MKYKSIIILVLTIFVLISIAGASATDTNDTAIASGDANQIDLSQNDEITDDLKASGDAPLTQPDNDETLSVENTPEIGSDDEGTYFDLIKEITNGGNKLSKSYYRYTGGGTINISGVDLDGNGAVIDMAGSSNVRVFSVMYETTFKNLTIKNVNYNGYGGAILFERLGTVEDCNFINNTAYAGSAIYFEDSRYQGTVKNCNFVDNKETAANKGGAIYSMVSVDITNCTFTNNSASCGGAIYSMGSRVDITNCTFTNNKATAVVGCGGAIYSMGNDVDITNCTFTNNKATGESGCGGAIYFVGDCAVTNCNFTGNNATTGSAILSPGDLSSITVSNSYFLNNRANVIDLLITKNDDNIIIDLEGNNNFLNAIYATGVTFTNVTYWGANGITNTDSSTPSESFREAGQNITVSIVVNDLIVLNEVRSTDENGRIVFDISAGENYFIGARHDTDSYYTEKVQTISNNIKFNVNVTSQTTNNKTVNLTAKSNIPNEVIKGKLLFILPNGTNITANYAGNGTWWAVHTLADYGVYQVNASYIGLDNVTVSNANITVSRANTVLTADTVTATYNINKNLVITLKDANRNAISGAKLIVNLKGVREYITDANGQVKVNVAKLVPKTYTAIITFNGDDIYVKSTRNVQVIVKKAKAKIVAKKKTFKKSKKVKKYTVKLKDNTGKAMAKVKLTLKVKGKTYKAKTNAKGKATFKIKNLKKKGTFKAKVKFAGNTYYNAVTKTVKIKIK